MWCPARPPLQTPRTTSGRVFSFAGRPKAKEIEESPGTHHLLLPLYHRDPRCATSSPQHILPTAPSTLPAGAISEAKSRSPGCWSMTPAYLPLPLHPTPFFAPPGPGDYDIAGKFQPSISMYGAVASPKPFGVPGPGSYDPKSPSGPAFSMRGRLKGADGEELAPKANGYGPASA